MIKNNEDHKNIEIKARCSDLKKIRKILVSQKADFQGVDHQIDTYFKVNNGRLKLREGNIENDLIFYNRENKRGPKKSEVILLKNNPKSYLKKILEASLRKLIIVDKYREIVFIKNVKFHLDKVKNLGTFVEIEARDQKGKFSQEKLLEQCNFYLKLFGIKEKDLINNSYSDMLLKKKK
jgi:predicted adenylyl cyclase CyaB